MTATEVPIKASQATAKLRDPIVVALLDLVTLGIYGFVWYYLVHRELAELGRARGTSELGDSPRTSLLAVMPGFLLVVPLIVSFWNAPRRVEAAQRLAAQPEARRINPTLAFILMLLVFPAGAGYVQAHLNRVWAIEGEPAKLGARGAASVSAASS